jgi:tetratricopeptide (TPR) repeat protein
MRETTTVYNPVTSRIPLRLASILVGLLLATPIHAQDRIRAGLSEATRLSAVYDEILNGRFARARALLADSCPPAPVEACLALHGAVLWWQVVLDPEDRTLDAQLESAAITAVNAAAAWTTREPRRAEAWFYLAGAHAPLVQWRVLRGERLAAARDGNRIRSSLERALALDPTLHDAKFGIGLYHYYADVAPAAARLLRWLLLLPGGDRRQGLQEVLETRERGLLLRGEADFQLHWLYLWYENQPQRALELLKELDERYPANPVFLQRVAEVQGEYFHDQPASAAAWQSLLERARSGRTSANALAEARAQLGLAIAHDAMYETDRVIEPLKALIAARPSAPAGVVGHAHLLLGAAYDRLGQRQDAIRSYRAALDTSSANSEVHTRARRGLSRQPDATEASAYRLALEGLRLLERGDTAAAVASLGRAGALQPGDAVIQTRYARALIADGRHADARAELERVLDARETPPAIVHASACVAYARLLEQSGDRARAITYYERALGVVGGERRAREDAARAIQRLRS